ncbi:Metalloprotease [Sanghuangporus baumii]|uniref:Metalloprotease n=1 Tax=Sanghuangporus baumii TaxID=108892 RepID=A0A9Q5I5G4_SANBA|nr:Metalloprotease [Sanghuangporus baumii]
MAERVGTRELAARAATVSVYFHAVSEDDTVAGGNIPESQILDQIPVLNFDFDFSATGVSFTLAEITRTVNSNWFNNAGPRSSLQTVMKQSLRQGDAAALNVYNVGFNSAADQGLLGYARSRVPTAATQTMMELLCALQPCLEAVRPITMEDRCLLMKLDTGSAYTTPSRAAVPGPATWSMTRLQRLSLLRVAQRDATLAPPLALILRTVHI